MSQTELRVVAFIDGFNFYRALTAFSDRNHTWFNYRAFIEFYVPKDSCLKEIIFFTSDPHHKPEQLKRHNLFNRVLSTLDIRVVHGKYKSKDRRCYKCNQYFTIHQEKYTDVNIATTLLEYAFTDRYDIALLISADSDFLPAVEAVKRNKPEKQVWSLLPPCRPSRDLARVCDRQIVTDENKLDRFLLQDTVLTKKGRKITNPHAISGTSS